MFASDGDIEEGITHEASSLAAHQELGNLTLIYDDNHISIEDDTLIAKSEDVAARYAAYGWHVQNVDWLNEDGSYTENVQALYEALLAARNETGPALDDQAAHDHRLAAPHKKNTGAAHGSALGADEVAATKEILGFDPAISFPEADDLVAHARGVIERGKAAHAEWNEAFATWSAGNAERAQLFSRLAQRELPAGWDKALPVFPPDAKGMATRKASGEVLSALAPVLPELWGGSADLAESNLTTMKGEPSFIPEERETKMFPGNKYGRTLHFGIREHAMGAILNGIALHGVTRPYGGTFLVFSDYMRPAVRLAALMELPVTYVWTHDSIGLGEDGPTHQPVEHLWALRAIPNLEVIRPGDANETVAAWKAILERHKPSALRLSRQNMPVLDRSRGRRAGQRRGIARGGYVLAEADGGDPAVILIATGSEVQIALAARDELQARRGQPTRVVSMPCVEWFAEQESAYREEVLPAPESGHGFRWKRASRSAGGSTSVNSVSPSGWSTSAPPPRTSGCTRSSGSRRSGWPRWRARPWTGPARP